MVLIREATLEDNDALIELERQSFLDLGDHTLAFDRSPNFFAHQQMQEHSRVLVAEEGGRLVAVVAGAWHDVLIERRRRRLLYIHQGRTLTEYRRRHIASDLVIQSFLLAREQGVERPYWLISPDNDVSLAFNRQIEVEAWPVNGRMDGFDVASRRSHGKDVGAVGPADLQEVVSLLNETHLGREMFLPYTPESLQRRLQMTPDYTWRQWRGCRHNGVLVAAAGIWDYNRSLRIIVEDKSSGTAHVSAPAYVLDYGYQEGADEAMLGVFMSLMGVAARSDRNELWIALPTERRLFTRVEALPHVTTIFHVLTPDIRAPLDMRGSVYLDPVFV
jgi:ribosomal protein S18 acetylase RimI-like enzyme